MTCQNKFLVTIIIASSFFYKALATDYSLKYPRHRIQEEIEI